MFRTKNIETVPPHALALCSQRSSNRIALTGTHGFLLLSSHRPLMWKKGPIAVYRLLYTINDTYMSSSTPKVRFSAVDVPIESFEHRDMAIEPQPYGSSPTTTAQKALVC